MTYSWTGHSLYQDLALKTTTERSWLLSLIVVTSTLLFSVGIRVYRLWFSPLSNIPGPWYAAVSNLWIDSHAARFRLCRVIEGQYLLSSVTWLVD